MLLFVLASNGILVTEDKVELREVWIDKYSNAGEMGGHSYLRAGACEIRTEHDNPRSLIIKVFAATLKPIFKKLDVSTAAVASLLVFDFVLNDQRFILKVNWLGK